MPGITEAMPGITEGLRGVFRVDEDTFAVKHGEAWYRVRPGDDAELFSAWEAWEARVAGMLEATNLTATPDMAIP